MDTIEQCDARLQELKAMAKAISDQEPPIWDEQHKIEQRKVTILRLSLIELVNDKAGFDKRCFELMGVAQKDFPTCFCEYHGTIATTLYNKFEQFHRFQIDVKAEHLMFCPHPGHPEAPITSLMLWHRACCTIDDCLETLRKHLKQIRIDELQAVVDRFSQGW